MINNIERRGVTKSDRIHVSQQISHNYLSNEEKETCEDNSERRLAKLILVIIFLTLFQNKQFTDMQQSVNE
jgi:hypothetical protein